MRLSARLLKSNLLSAEEYWVGELRIGQPSQVAFCAWRLSVGSGMATIITSNGLAAGFTHGPEPALVSQLYDRVYGSEERYRSIFEQVQFGVAVVTLEGRLSTVNPAFARLLGYSPDDLSGKPLLEVTHPEDAIAKRLRLAELSAGLVRQVSLEGRYVRKSGGSVWGATNVSLLRDESGMPAYFLCTVQDIDELKKAEDERNRLQQQLFQAQKMEALGTLAGGIAHDFNNLLSVMLGFASLARQRLGADHPLQDSMGMIEQSAVRAADLARQLLAFARPERQQVKPLCVTDVLDRVRRMVGRTFDRNITVEVHTTREPLWVNTEPSYLEQALLNMCINARDAMPEGGALTLAATTTTFDTPQAGPTGSCPAGTYVTIAVEDTGVGIPPDALPRVFEPFFTTKEPVNGTGLGLAMVYGFVKNHDGFVKVESEPAQRTRFTIGLPLIPAPAARPVASGMEPVEPGRGTVLVVDDEPMVRAFAAEGLKRLGYEVLVAENGTRALQIYAEQQGRINCVLLDLIMPEPSGLETFRRLRGLNPDVAVVFASGFSTGEILRNAPDARSAAFLGKPYTLEALSSAIRNAGRVSA
jgi:two-component system sensor histidine kinase EvgS